jgi:hypothetical protein
VLVSARRAVGLGKNGFWELAACAALLAASGCEKITEKVTETVIERAIEKETGGEVDIEADKGVSFKGKDNQGRDVVYDAKSGKVPDNWPSDVPVYPGVTVKASLQGNGNRTLVLESTDSPEKVVAFYKGKLSGMKQEADMNMNGSMMLSFDDTPKQRKVLITAAVQGDKTAVNLAVTEQRQ